LSGLLRPDEVFDMTGISLPDESDYETIAGLIVSRLHRIARVGDTVDIGDAVLRVDAMDRLRIDRVTLSRRVRGHEGPS
ncbi:MAG: transporter associated domain-containing protein, partial [Actinomycetes bacterium]